MPLVGSGRGGCLFAYNASSLSASVVANCVGKVNCVSETLYQACGLGIIYRRDAISLSAKARSGVHDSIQVHGQMNVGRTWQWPRWLQLQTLYHIDPETLRSHIFFDLRAKRDVHPQARFVESQDRIAQRPVMAR